ncbi:MAG: DUF4139 domain-containing protein [Deltaproteobacteria bacterium]|nr:DUF4139 domain-containing protein [Deltaproteobacteria bacterium]
MTNTTNEIELTHKLEQATIYEDRVDVVRTASVTLSAGAHALRFRLLSPLVDEDRLVARLEGPGHVDDVVVVRYVVDDGLDEIKNRREQRGRARQRLRTELQLAQDDADLSQHELRATEQSLSLWSVANARRLGRGLASNAPADQDAALAAFQTRLLQAADVANAAHAQLARLQESLKQIDLEDARPEPTRKRRVCDVIVRASSTGGDHKVVLTTVLPCAAWRPTHEARLLREGTSQRVRFVTHAAVWNRTGEAWTGVKLVLSTARPALGAELPPLSADRLSLRQKTAEERKTIVVEHRVEAIPDSATKGGAPGVDDGGEARVFSVPACDIPDDGRPHQVELASFEAPAATAKVAVPEKAPQVFLRASFVNAGRGPILAGPVTLVDNGAWTGTGDVLYTGAGEDLDLSFGSDDRFAVRMNKRCIIEKKTLGKDIEHWLQEVTLTSTATTSEQVLVLLRLPVSEVAQVKVLQSPQHGTEGELKLDAHGLARVTTTIEPGRERRIATAFSFDTSGDVRMPPPW